MAFLRVTLGSWHSFATTWQTRVDPPHVFVQLNSMIMSIMITSLISLCQASAVLTRERQDLDLQTWTMFSVG